MQVVCFFFTATRGYLMHIYQIIVLSVYAYKSTSHTGQLKRHYYIFKYWSTSLELSLELELELHLKCNVILWRSMIICCYLLFKYSTCTERGWGCSSMTVEGMVCSCNIPILWKSSGWCGKTPVTCTEPWPQPHRTGWTEAPTIPM